MKTEGGQGGRKGHSNMTHYDRTEWIKYRMRKLRRKEGKRLIEEERRWRC